MSVSQRFLVISPPVRNPWFLAYDWRLHWHWRAWLRGEGDSVSRLRQQLITVLLHASTRTWWITAMVNVAIVARAAVTDVHHT